MTQPHHFEFSRNWSGSDRLCGACHQTYDAGEHIEITTLKPYTSYVCPDDTGLGHSSTWTGAYPIELRTLHQHLCICGREFVEEDRETWRLSWEMRDDTTRDWRPVEKIGTRYSTEQQRDGLLTMPDDIRNVKLARLVEHPGARGLWPGAS